MSVEIDTPVLVILGPTAVGKTETALALAHSLQGEIVSADSRLLYIGMDIGTAKPSREEQARIPHHLIDVTTPDQPWTMVRYIRAAGEAIERIHARGRLPMIVGGTGQYVQALLEGWDPPPKGSELIRSTYRQKAQEQGAQALHDLLAARDPDSANKIDHRNVRRVIRALEIMDLTGEPASSQKKKTPPPYRTMKIGLIRPREELYARIDARIDRMLSEGLVAEVQALLDAGYSPDLPAMSAIGYRQIIAALQGDMCLEEAVARIRKLTRQFVRRQANWWKPDDPGINWFRATPDVTADILAAVQVWQDDPA